MKIAYALILTLLLCSCNTEDDLIKDSVYRGFGTPISESIVEICYKEYLYRVEIVKSPSSSYGRISRVIPLTENIENKFVLKRCSNNSIRYKTYNQ